VVARRKDVHLENFVADDVDPYLEHPVRHQLGPDNLRYAPFGVLDLDRFSGTAEMDVGWAAVGRVMRRIARMLAQAIGAAFELRSRQTVLTLALGVDQRYLGALNCQTA